MNKLLLCVLLFVTLSATCFASVIPFPIYYVKEVASGDGSGSSWANASGDLQLMMNNARAGIQVWVAAGTYLPVRRADAVGTITLNDRNNAFVLQPDVKVYGGFAGTETYLSDRVQNSNISTLSGDFGNNDGANFANNGENAYHVVISSGDVKAAEINGFTISGGNAYGMGTIQVNSQNALKSEGGGFYNLSSSPIVTYVSIKSNYAYYDGGGICNTSSSSPKLTNLTISGNSTNNNGGGMGNYTASSPTLTNVTISGNTGDGMYNHDSSPILTNVTISGNDVGLYNYGTSSPTINNTIVYNNSTGIYNFSGPVPVYQYSLVQGNPIGTSMQTYSGVPTDVFKNPLTPGLSTGGDYSLKAGTSPAIDNGDNSLYTPYSANINTDKDLAGQPRLFNTTIDMGAYEWRTSPLQVTMVSFSAILQGKNDALLQWETASELNNKGYGIEMSSTGFVFESKCFVQGNGTSNKASSYQSVMPNLVPGIYYFRLKVIALDGGFTYSPTRVVIVTSALEASVNIYPNPVVDGYLYINFPNANTAKATLKITNSTGQLIKQTALTTTEDQIKIMLPAAKGFYYIEVIMADGKTITKKVMNL